MHHDRDRVISVSLTEPEWQAFIARHPRPVDWLRARILDEVQLEAPRDAKEVAYEAHVAMRSAYFAAE